MTNSQIKHPNIKFIFHIIHRTRSQGALLARLLVDFVLRALLALTPCDPDNDIDSMFPTFHKFKFDRFGHFKKFVPPVPKIDVALRITG